MHVASHAFLMGENTRLYALIIFASGLNVTVYWLFSAATNAFDRDLRGDLPVRVQPLTAYFVRTSSPILSIQQQTD